MRRNFYWLIVIMIIATACSEQSEIEASPVTPIPSDTPVPATDTPGPTDTPIPTETATPIPTATPFPPFRDDFETLMESGWTWVRENPLLWNLNEKPGFLQIVLEPQKEFVGDDRGCLSSKNILLRPAPKGNFEVTTRILFGPYTNFHLAGITVYQDDCHTVNLKRAFCRLEGLPESHCKGNALYFDYWVLEEASPEGFVVVEDYPTVTLQQSEAILRLTREGNIYMAYYSEDNGETWTMFGRHEVDLLPSFVGLLVSTDWDHPTTANFDYFTLKSIP